jgi:hypothetical protein
MKQELGWLIHKEEQPTQTLTFRRMYRYNNIVYQHGK